MLRWDDDTHAAEYPRWVVFGLGMVAGLVLSWAQYAAWATR